MISDWRGRQPEKNLTTRLPDGQVWRNDNVTMEKKQGDQGLLLRLAFKPNRPG